MGKNEGQIITGIVPGSIAEELEVLPGMRLLSVNGQRVRDVFDYRFLVDETELEVLLADEGGAELLLEIEKDIDEDLGLCFADPLMDGMRGCTNRCVFCFIDQLPRGMRKTLYFKDDDARLSFLQGNYITLTNLAGEDLERIIRYRMSPINISVHTTNPALRNEMLGNAKAGASLSAMRALFDAGIEMNAQIVLCRGMNDGAELDRTIADLSAYRPLLRSVSVVPVGLTRYREKLTPLKAFDRKSAAALIRQIEGWQERLAADGKDPLFPHFVHASDEWYLMAEKEIPAQERYDNYPQIENGVGMVRSLLEEWGEALSKAAPYRGGLRRVGLVSGTLIAPVMREFLLKTESVSPGLSVLYQPIENDFFGHTITVSGLVTGQDLIAQYRAALAALPKEERPSEIVLPRSMLRSGTSVFLDDVDLAEAEAALKTVLRPVPLMSGAALFAALRGEPLPEEAYQQAYEPWET